MRYVIREKLRESIAPALCNLNILSNALWKTAGAAVENLVDNV